LAAMAMRWGKSFLPPKLSSVRPRNKCYIALIGESYCKALHCWAREQEWGVWRSASKRIETSTHVERTDRPPRGSKIQDSSHENNSITCALPLFPRPILLQPTWPRPIQLASNA
jgi:hypothetical protein